MTPLRILEVKSIDFYQQTYLRAIGIGLPITEEPSHTTGQTGHVSGDSADQAD